MRNYVFNGAVLTGGIGVTVTIFVLYAVHRSCICCQFLEDIFRGAYHYLVDYFLGIPFTLLYNYLSSILRSLWRQPDTLSVSGIFSNVEYLS